MNRAFVIILCLIIPFLWIGTRTIKSIQYNQNCGGYLKRAADSNTVDQAKEQLKIAITYMENNNLTSGYTSVLWKTPDEDVGFWYKNIKTAYDELEKISPDASQLEKTNVLMKLRETLLDNGESGTIVTEPDGISVFPNNVAFAIFGTISLILLLPILIVPSMSLL